MKKVLVLLFIVAVAFGFSGAFASPGGTCGDLGLPVDALCTDVGDPDDPNDDQECLIWINLGDPPDADGCHNPPPPPAL